MQNKKVEKKKKLLRSVDHNRQNRWKEVSKHFTEYNFHKQNSLVVLEALQAQYLLWDQLDPKQIRKKNILILGSTVTLSVKSKHHSTWFPLEPFSPIAPW